MFKFSTPFFILACAVLLFSNLFENATFAENIQNIYWNTINYEDDKRKITTKLPGDKLPQEWLICEKTSFGSIYNNVWYSLSVSIDENFNPGTLEERIKGLENIAAENKLPKPNITIIEANHPNVLYSLEIKSIDKIRPRLHHINRIFTTAKTSYYFHIGYFDALTSKDIQVIDEIL